MTQAQQAQANLERTERFLAKVDAEQATRKANVFRVVPKPKRETPPSLKGSLNGGGKAFSLLK